MQYFRLVLGSIGVVVLAAICIGLGVAILRPTAPAEAPPGSATISSSSMEPSFRVGARIDYFQRQPSALKRGDVVVYRIPGENGDRFLVKRIVALPGERIALNGGRLVIDGASIDEPYVAQLARQSMSPVHLEAGEYFVLADQRATTADSRAHGPISVEQILGVVVLKE